MLQELKDSGFTEALNAAAFLEEKEFVTIIRYMPGGYEFEIIWEEEH